MPIMHDSFHLFPVSAKREFSDRLNKIYLKNMCRLDLENIGSIRELTAFSFDFFTPFMR